VQEAFVGLRQTQQKGTGEIALLKGKKKEPFILDRWIIFPGFDSGRFSGYLLALDSLYRKDVYGPLPSFSATKLEVTCRTV
jgi:hypothetical protein